MKQDGYYRNPAIKDDALVFVSDDDLWTVPLKGGKAERLTSGVGSADDPVFSPDEKWIAFTGTYEGHPEIYLIPSEGGEPRRLTFISEGCTMVGWTPEGEVIFSSTKNHPFRLRNLYKIALEKGTPERLPCGPANFISYLDQGKGCVIQRHGYGYVSWKRYRGGTAGDLWIDKQGKGNFSKLISIKGNALRPFWIQNRIYFISDHQGHGNIYSCTQEGTDLKRHTSHEDFFVRGLSYDKDTLVYTAGADIYCYSLKKESSKKLKVDFYSSFPQRARKFVDTASYLSHYALDRTGSKLALTSRGRPFSMANWEGAVQHYGEPENIRYKGASWLHDNKRLLIVSDREGEDHLEIHHSDPLKAPKILKRLDLGRVLSLKVSPKEDEVALVNHRCELFHINLKTQKRTLIDKSNFGDIHGIDWAPDGKWVVYDFPLCPQTRAIKLCEIKEFKTHTITRPVLEDFRPSFDPGGKFIYFLSKRTFSPIYDNLQFEMGFPKGEKPYLIVLDKNTTSPFVPSLHEEEAKPKKAKKEEGEKKLKIDLDGIENRILEFPVPEGSYSTIRGIPGKALYMSQAMQSALGGEENPTPRGSLHCYDFATQKEDLLVSKISSFTLSGNHQWLCYYGAKKLRVIKAGEKPQDIDPTYRKGGWINLNRVKLSITPPKEWSQILDEVWRLQKEFFWTEDMSKVDWGSIYKRYRPLLDRIGTREELSDLIAEMHGELGSSHAYVFGGDTRRPPLYPLGDLGADFTYDKDHKGYRISNITKGDPWTPSQTSPLTSPGLNIKEGDILLSVNGYKLDQKMSPQQAIVNQAGNMVSLQLKGKKKDSRSVFVRTLASQTPARYRDWVEKNRAYVHKKTKGKIGYIHIPDMSAKGFAEFHRGFLAELDREGLVVDVRFNGGGNVSGLLLEKLI